MQRNAIYYILIQYHTIMYWNIIQTIIIIHNVQSEQFCWLPQAVYICGVIPVSFTKTFSIETF